MTQLPLLNLPEINPTVQAAAQRELARVVRQTRNSFECAQFRRKRTAMLKVTRRAES